jgi:hypothetical protein
VSPSRRSSEVVNSIKPGLILHRRVAWNFHLLARTGGFLRQLRPLDSQLAIAQHRRAGLSAIPDHRTGSALGLLARAADRVPRREVQYALNGGPSGQTARTAAACWASAILQAATARRPQRTVPSRRSGSSTRSARRIQWCPAQTLERALPEGPRMQRTSRTRRSLVTTTSLEFCTF